MATFVQIEPDAFGQSFNGFAADSIQARDENGELVDNDFSNRIYHHVRRPVRGIQVKDDKYATIQVRNAAGDAFDLFDEAADDKIGKGPRNSNFLIQSVTEQRAEKNQIVLTFGEPYIFFFGEQPRIINITGVLLNTDDFNWRAEWWANYDQFLRGTQCVRMRTRVYLSWDDIVTEGYIMQASAVESAENKNLVQFQFQMFLTNYQNISRIGSPFGNLGTDGIVLDPSNLDLPSMGDDSSTALVRQANIQSAQLQQGQGSDSLFDSLRQGQFGAASTTLVSLSGQVVDLLSLAGQFVSGRNIRVPVGFTGAAAFDQQVQIAIASVPGAAQVINGNEPGRVVTLQTGVSGLIQEFSAALQSKTGPALIGEPLSHNEDEFVARIVEDGNGRKKFGRLFSGQFADNQAAAQKVKDVYEAFGINTDPTDEVTLLFRKAMFGIVGVAAGLELQNSSTLRSVTNLL
jgi:hypothetical protein